MAPRLKEGIGSEASLTVPDFNISLHGSSCNYVFFSLIPVTLLPFLNIGISNAEWETKNWTEKEKNREYDQNRENCMNCCFCLAYTSVTGLAKVSLPLQGKLDLELHSYIVFNIL